MIDSKDPTYYTKIKNGSIDWNALGGNYDFMRAACDINEDWQITDYDKTLFNNDKNYSQKVMNSYGYVKSLH